MTESKNGRRVIVAPVTGAIGARIQAWREKYDPQQALRLPPHATIMYWANFDVDDAAVDAQIRHAFPSPVIVRLGDVHTFQNPDRTRYIEVQETEHLNNARSRLFDGSYFEFPDQRTEWDWHVTVVRYGVKADENAVNAAIPELDSTGEWVIDVLLLLELRDGVHEEVRRWEV